MEVNVKKRETFYNENTGGGGGEAEKKRIIRKI